MTNDDDWTSTSNPPCFSLERETGIEPATNSLEGCDSTTELLPPGSPTTNRETKLMELTERLELSTSPLPRECSTTELRQHRFPCKSTCKGNLTILSRTEPSKHHTEGKKREQYQT
jgi:hypothetical protein